MPWRTIFSGWIPERMLLPSISLFCNWMMKCLELHISPSLLAYSAVDLSSHFFPFVFSPFILLSMAEERTVAVTCHLNIYNYHTFLIHWYQNKWGKYTLPPLMYPPIGNLTPNVYFLVDDLLEVVSVCHRGPSVNMPVILDGNRVTCSARSRLTRFTSPNYPRHHLTHSTYIVDHYGAYFLSFFTPKQTVGAGEIRFRSLTILDNATIWTVGDCYLRVGFLNELGNICNEATLLLRASGLCVNLVHRKKNSVEGFENVRITRYKSKTLINCKFIWWGCCRFSLFWKLGFRLCPLLKWAVFMTFGFGKLICIYGFAWFWNNIKQFFNEFLSKGNKNSNTHTRCMMKCLNQSAELWEAWWRFLENTELLMHCSSMFC